jgi:hypothetical protein
LGSIISGTYENSGLSSEKNVTVHGFRVQRFRVRAVGSLKLACRPPAGLNVDS